MAEIVQDLLSVGIDIGTTTTHLVVSKLLIEKAKIIDRKIIFSSDVQFTPLTENREIDAAAVALLIENAYKAANLKVSDIGTGAVIITGESARARNAAQVSSGISKVAGDFVVETAGPKLESLLAARGSGAIAHSRGTGKLILNVDIGGGTSNLALVKAGEVIGLSCINIGGRCLNFTNGQRSAAADMIFAASGMTFPRCEAGKEDLAQYLASLLLASFAPDRSRDCRSADLSLLERLHLTEALNIEETPDELWFSGGVAALIKQSLSNPSQYQKLKSENPFGDMGVYLADALSKMLNKKGGPPFKIAEQDIRATVIGASSETLQMSGLTINIAGDELPLKNLPLLKIKVDQASVKNTIAEAVKLRGGAPWSERVLAFYLDFDGDIDFTALETLATELATACAEHQAREPYVFVLSKDLAMALSQLLLSKTGNKRIITVDCVDARSGDYLDIGLPIGKSGDPGGSCVTIMVKALLFYK